MKIITTECIMRELPLKEPYTIAYESISSCNNLFLIAETDAGIKGFGCAAPDKSVTGETPEMVMEAFKKTIEPALKNADPFRYIHILEKIKQELKGHPSALAMTDMMLHDLVAKKCQVPLYKFLGGFRTRIVTSITVPILTVDETLNKVKNHLDQGFSIIKLKGGLSTEEDIEKILLLDKTFGKKLSLRFDANQGYTVEQAIHFVRSVKKCNVELLEQPTPREYIEMLGKVSRNVHLPVMADESIMTLKDAFLLTRHDLTDMINIKLMKAGGIVEGLHINSVARAAGVETMVGCMDESALAISAGMHFALSRPNILFADLDGHLDLINDPAEGSVHIRKGIIYPSNRPGLGVKKLKL